MKLTDIFDSTSGKGLSKKIIVLFVTGTVLPLLSSFGIPSDILTILGQLAAIYLGGQSAVDAASKWRAVPAGPATVTTEDK